MDKELIDHKKSAKHTPGPWEVGGSTEFINQLRIDPCIGVVYGAGDELLANARLIAAAPDMLETLKKIVAMEDTETNEWDALERVIPTMCRLARAAIAKATGVTA